MSAHTPGPWEFVGNSLVGSKIDDKPIGLRPVIFRSEVGVRQSDAKLIATAPELLEALKVLSEWVESQISDNECRPLENARAAITKATGGAA